jgi:regulator of sigma E protease
MVEILRKIAFFVLMLGTLIIVHEAGHWLACAWLGIAVKEFGIGLPPRLAKIGTWRGTVISLNWLPVGGFVRPEGESDPKIPRGLAASASWKRLLIFAAGPIANFALAYLVFTVGFMAGWPERVLILETTPGSPAEAAGILPGDLILNADGQPIRYPDALAAIARDRMRQPVTLVIQRGDITLNATLVPDTSWSPDGIPIGVRMQRSIVSYALPDAMRRAGETMVNQFVVTAETIAKLVQGTPIAGEQPRVVGIVGLKQISDRAVENSVAWAQWFPVLNLIAFISTALGIANLLPFPALDGGRIVFVLVEMVGRRRVNSNIERWANVAGLVVLLGLMVVLIVRDLAEPVFSR